MNITQRVMSLISIFILSACVANQEPVVDRVEAPKVSQKPLQVPNAHELIQLTSEAFRANQEANTPFKGSIFDLNEMNGKKNYKDSNYHIKNTILTTTFRPKSLYGSNFYKYVSYCPIFYDSHDLGYIENYFNSLNLIIRINKNDLANYLSLTAFSSCALLNQNYKLHQKESTETENLILADKFAITLFLSQSNREWVDLIVHHNNALHQKHIVNEDNLEKFLEKIKTYQLKDKTTKTTYGWWLITQKIDKMK